MAAPGTVTVDKALADSNLLGAALGPVETWATWLAVLKAAFGNPLAPDEVETFSEVSGGRGAPDRAVKELWTIAGRRSGKSRMAAAIGTFIAAFGEHRLAPGEQGFVLILAPTRAQAGIIHSYCRAFLEESPILRQLIRDVRGEEIVLDNGAVIAVSSASYRTVRGRTLLAAVLDESAFFRSEESTNPDIEIVRALGPALMTTRGPLIGISTPYSQKGVLWDRFRRFYGVDAPDVLVVQAPTRLLNPLIESEEIEVARRLDPESAAAEWDAQFRSDLQTYVDRETLERCVEPGAAEGWPAVGIRYVAFADMSGGVKDSAALSIAHVDGDAVVLDLAREWRAPHSPQDVADEMAEELRRWRITRVWGDKYAGELVSEAFQKNAIRYVNSPKNKSDIYLEALPLFTSRRAVLYENDRLFNQLTQLERRLGRSSGRDRVDHGPGGRDDLANAVCGSLVMSNAAPAVERARSVMVEGATQTYDAMEG